MLEAHFQNIGTYFGKSTQTSTKKKNILYKKLASSNDYDYFHGPIK